MVSSKLVAVVLVFGCIAAAQQLAESLDDVCLARSDVYKADVANAKVFKERDFKVIFSGRMVFANETYVPLIPREVHFASDEKEKRSTPVVTSHERRVGWGVVETVYRKTEEADHYKEKYLITVKTDCMDIKLITAVRNKPGSERNYEFDSIELTNVVSPVSGTHTCRFIKEKMMVDESRLDANPFTQLANIDNRKFECFIKTEADVTYYEKFGDLVVDRMIVLKMRAN